MSNFSATMLTLCVGSLAVLCVLVVCIILFWVAKRSIVAQIEYTLTAKQYKTLRQTLTFLTACFVTCFVVCIGTAVSLALLGYLTLVVSWFAGGLIPLIVFVVGLATVAIPSSIVLAAFVITCAVIAYVGNRFASWLEGRAKDKKAAATPATT